MNPRSTAVLAAALLAAAVPFAGCGGGSSTSSPTAPAGSATAPAGSATTSGGATSTAPSGGTSTSPGSGSSGSGVNGTTAGVAAVGACKGAVQAQSISAATKHRLEAICEKAASGNIQDIKRTAEQACQELVRSRIPAGSTQETALARCVHH